jgi:hypothetical protein
VLVKKVAGAILLLLIARALGFGPAMARAVGVGLHGRLFSLVSLPESLEVDHIAHAGLHHPASRRQDDSLARKMSLRVAKANLMVMQNPRVMFSDSIKKFISALRKPNNTCSYHASPRWR